MSVSALPPIDQATTSNDLLDSVVTSFATEEFITPKFVNGEEEEEEDQSR